MLEVLDISSKSLLGLSSSEGSLHSPITCPSAKKKVREDNDSVNNTHYSIQWNLSHTDTNGAEVKKVSYVVRCPYFGG